MQSKEIVYDELYSRNDIDSEFVYTSSTGKAPSTYDELYRNEENCNLTTQKGLLQFLYTRHIATLGKKFSARPWRWTK